jgi:hypothetical protein
MRLHSPENLRIYNSILNIRTDSADSLYSNVENCRSQHLPGHASKEHRHTLEKALRRWQILTSSYSGLPQLAICCSAAIQNSK